MSRSQDRKCYYSRWSEPVLRRRYSMHLVPTSEEDTSSIRRSRSSSPLLNSIRQPMPQLDHPNGRCSCRAIHYNKKKTSKNHSANSSKKSNGSQQMRESLEIQLVGSQVEETLAGDKQTALIQHLEFSTNALDALIQHVHSLQVSHISAQRVVHLADQLILSHSPTIINYNSSLSTDLATRISEAESYKENRLRLLREVVDNCSKNITTSKRLHSLIDDHKMKKEDFNVAARNFKNLLENSKLTVSQMDKLQWQYQAIMDDYKQNRKVLDAELPKIIKTQLGAIRQGFCKIAAFHEDTDYPKRISDLLKILSENIIQEEQATENHHHNHRHNHQYGKSETEQEIMCQKCKVNRVEKK